MPIRGKYRPSVEARIDESRQRYLAACSAYVEALLDEDVVTRLMPYRDIDYPDGDLPVSPLTRAYPGAPPTPVQLVGVLARAHPDVAGERVQRLGAEAEAAGEEFTALIEDAEFNWEPEPEDALELEAE